MPDSAPAAHGGAVSEPAASDDSAGAPAAHRPGHPAGDAPPGPVPPGEADPVARVWLHGKPLFALPADLYVPPDALQVFLDAFEGPLDLLLYLIRRQNFDLVDIRCLGGLTARRKQISEVTVLHDHVQLVEHAHDRAAFGEYGSGYPGGVFRNRVARHGLQRHRTPPLPTPAPAAGLVQHGSAGRHQHRAPGPPNSPPGSPS